MACKYIIKADSELGKLLGLDNDSNYTEDALRSLLKSKTEKVAFSISFTELDNEKNNNITKAFKKSINELSDQLPGENSTYTFKEVLDAFLASVGNMELVEGYYNHFFKAYNEYADEKGISKVSDKVGLKIYKETFTFHKAVNLDVLKDLRDSLGIVPTSVSPNINTNTEEHLKQKGLGVNQPNNVVGQTPTGNNIHNTTPDATLNIEFKGNHISLGYVENEKGEITDDEFLANSPDFDSLSLLSGEVKPGTKLIIKAINDRDFPVAVVENGVRLRDENGRVKSVFNEDRSPEGISVGIFLVDENGVVADKPAMVLPREEDIIEETTKKELIGAIKTNIRTLRKTLSEKGGTLNASVSNVSPGNFNNAKIDTADVQTVEGLTSIKDSQKDGGTLVIMDANNVFINAEDGSVVETVKSEKNAPKSNLAYQSVRRLDGSNFPVGIVLPPLSERAIETVSLLSEVYSMYAFLGKKSEAINSIIEELDVDDAEKTRIKEKIKKLKSLKNSLLSDYNITEKTGIEPLLNNFINIGDSHKGFFTQGKNINFTNSKGTVKFLPAIADNLDSFSTLENYLKELNGSLTSRPGEPMSKVVTQNIAFPRGGSKSDKYPGKIKNFFFINPNGTIDTTQSYTDYLKSVIKTTVKVYTNPNTNEPVIMIQPVVNYKVDGELDPITGKTAEVKPKTVQVTETINNDTSLNTPTAPSPTQPTQQSGEVEEGVSEVFAESPELAKIGTQKQYSEYLDSKLYNSKEKRILTHSSWTTNIEEFEKKPNTNFGGFGQLGEGVYLSDLASTSYWRHELGMEESTDGKTYKVIVDLRKTLPVNNFLTKEKSKTIDKSVDATFEAKQHHEHREDWKPSHYAVRNVEKITILGSKKDIQAFKDFVGKSTQQSNEVNTIQAKTDEGNIVTTTKKNGITTVKEETKTGDVVIDDTYVAPEDVDKSPSNVLDDIVAEKDLKVISTLDIEEGSERSYYKALKNVLNQLGIDSDNPLYTKVKNELGYEDSTTTIGEQEHREENKKFAEDVREILSEFATEDVNLSIAEFHTVVDYIYNTAAGKLILEDKNNATQIMEEAFSQLEKELEDITSVIEGIKEGLADNLTAEDLDVLNSAANVNKQNIIAARSAIVAASLEKLKVYTGAKLIKEDGSVELQEQEIEKSYTKGILEMDSKMSSSGELKLFLSNIMKTGKRGEALRGYMGTPLFMTFDEVYDNLKAIINDPTDVDANFEVILLKLKNISEVIPNATWLKAVVSRLKEADDQIQRQFTMEMAQHNSTSKFVMFKENEEDGIEYTLYETNSNTAEKAIKDAWNSDLLESDLIQVKTVDNKEIHTINKTKVASLIEEYTKLERLEKADVKGIRKFLENFGISLETKTLEAYLEEEGNIFGKTKFMGQLKAYLDKMVKEESDTIELKKDSESYPFANMNNLIKGLVAVEVKHGLYTFSNSYRDGDKTMYRVGQGKHATDVLRDVKKENSSYRKNLLDKSYNKHSLYLNMIQNEFDNDKEKPFTEKFNIVHLANSALKELWR